MADISFICSCCGQEIKGIPDRAYRAPDHYFDVPEEERDDRTKLSDDLCHIDYEDWYIRAVCPIPIVGTDEFFGWGIWVSVGMENFEHYTETFSDSDQSKIGTMLGRFSNKLPNYPDTLRLETTVEPRNDNQRPFVWIKDAHADHPLYVDQQKGITREWLGEFYASTLCKTSAD